MGGSRVVRMRERERAGVKVNGSLENYPIKLN